MLIALVGCSSEDGVPAGSVAPDGGSRAVDAGRDASAPVNDAAPASMTLTSSAFDAGTAIPKVHSCDGAGESIPLAWSQAPAGTQGFAVVMRDLTFTNGGDNYHWVIWDIPASITALPQGIANTPSPDPPGGGTKQTRWSYGAEIGYGNMCPISGPSTHEYELTLHAVSVRPLPLGAADGPNAIDALIRASSIAEAKLRGTYTKQ
jgi:Raf kinase inhibitor-like YbhB/YbcL family protein